MKRILAKNMIYFLLLIMLSACQSNASGKDSNISSTSNADEAYPINQSYPISSHQNDVTSAYPIPEEHIALLSKIWILSTRAENDVSQEPIEKTLILVEDGRYEIMTAENTSTGTWTTRTTPSGITLFLDIGTANVSLYEIQEMSENSLHIQFQQDDLKIDEKYISTD